MRERKCCTECSRRRRKVKECKPRGPGRKCWTCQKWNRECSFVHDYPPALKGLVFELSREHSVQHLRSRIALWFSGLKRCPLRSRSEARPGRCPLLGRRCVRYRFVAGNRRIALLLGRLWCTLVPTVPPSK